MTKEQLLALVERFAESQGADISNVPVNNSARAALEAALDGVCRDAERYRRIYADQIEDKETSWDAALRVDNGGQP